MGPYLGIICYKIDKNEDAKRPKGEYEGASPFNKKRDRKVSFLVIPSGFEPDTHSLEGCCSIQLSYGTKGDAKIILFYKVLSGTGAREELELLVEGGGEAVGAVRECVSDDGGAVGVYAE